VSAIRSLPRRLVGLVEAMEFEQPRVVTVQMLTQWSIETGAARDEAGAARLAYRLQDLGWLGSVRTKGAWEFIPGSRAGAVASGDRFIEFRAYFAVHPEWSGVLAMESAATVLGLAQHLPSREVVALPTGAAPKALSQWRVVTVTIPEVGCEWRDHMPTWNLEGLIAGIAIRPSGYLDVPGLAQWLPAVGKNLRASALAECLNGRPGSVLQRAAYLARIAGADDVAGAVLSQRPPKHPIWFGATRSGGTYDPVVKVCDADLAPYLDGGIGA